MEAQIIADIEKILSDLYQYEGEVSVQPTRKEFEGTYTFVVFPLVKQLRKKPQLIAEEIGQALASESDLVAAYNVVQGFLNLVVKSNAWVDTFNALETQPIPSQGKSIMVEFSSPNTNKPLHLGHLRNNFLGDSVARILSALGNEVVKTCLVNDRGIHICKSMLAYQKMGNGETPQSAGIKGDHLAGKYYVLFDKAYKEEIKALMDGGISEDEAKKQAPILLEAQQMLKKWEEGDAEVIALWEQMNNWVFEGFEQTYKAIGIGFDHMYKESQTYILGKDIVSEGLESGVFFKRDDGSVWIDLEDEGLDQKLVLRGDGTSVYITQDLGTTDLKFNDFNNDGSIWVVGNEQDYHFKVLFAILKKLGKKYADHCFHLSYGMVDLPSGKMKSREGTVVDADELVAEMIQTAEESTAERGKIDDFSAEEAEQLHKTLAMGALKYFLLKVEPKKRMLFNPKESIDFQGNTGPFIQYTHARIKSIMRKAAHQNIEVAKQIVDVELSTTEENLIFQLSQYPEALVKAGEQYAPSVIANYCYELAKQFNSFYGELSILNEEDENKRKARLAIAQAVATTLAKGMGLLGIDVPDRM